MLIPTKEETNRAVRIRRRIDGNVVGRQFVIDDEAPEPVITDEFIKFYSVVDGESRQFGFVFDGTGDLEKVTFLETKITPLYIKDGDDNGKEYLP